MIMELAGWRFFFRKKILCLLDKKKCKVYKTSQGNEVVGISSTCDLFYLGFITNPKNGEVKALSVRVP